MSAGRRSGRLPVVVKPTDVKNEINVTPLVDVVLVLLIIFMVIMPLLTKELAVKVPDTEQSEPDQTPPPDQLLVRIERTGEVKLNGATTSVEELETTLKGLLGGRAPANRTVFVGAHDEAPYKVLVDVFANARRAGAETLGMLAEPPSVAEAPGSVPEAPGAVPEAPGTAPSLAQ
ncbi:MAG: biopolymer transporter ExbD [Polyangiales bacterium]